MGSNLKKSSSSSPSNSEELTKDFRQLNDSVHELYAPQGEPGVVVIFFHGLSLEEDNYEEAYWKTWLSRDGSVVWPKEWLPGSLTSPWILSVSYDSYVRKHKGGQDSYTIAENLIENVILDKDPDKNTRVGQNSPVVLVGHSLGGIIIKEFLLACLTRRGTLFNNERAQHNIELIDNFLENCKGVFYYSTPHQGSEFIDSLEKKGVQLNGDLMKLLNVQNSKTARINHEFATARVGEEIETYSIRETLETKYMGFQGQIVQEASSRSDTGGFYSAVNVNHFDVCKPRNNKWCNIYTTLVGFINSAIQDKGPGLRNCKVEIVSMLVPEDYVPMGNRAYTSHPARADGPSDINRRPTKIEKKNDSVYQLCAPRGLPKVVVIFFHGLPQENDHSEAYWKTWLSRDGSVVWPKEWLPESLPNPQILSVSYDSSAARHDGASDSYIIAENLIQDIILNDSRFGQDCPVVLVGHGLGGIIIKELLLACFKLRGELLKVKSAKQKIERIETFLQNCKGVFYCSTPHQGSRFLDYLVTSEVPLNDELMELLKKLSSVTARINSSFANARLGEHICTRAFGESLDTKYMGFRGRIVEESSAKYDIDPLSFYTAHSADHFGVCKAVDRTSCSIFTSLVEFIETAIQDKRPGLRGKIVKQLVFVKGHGKQERRK